MNIKSLLLVPAAMAFALAAAPKDASAHNFPGWQARAENPNLQTCFSGHWSGITNSGTAAACTSGYVYVLMPLLGNGGGTQTLSYTSYVPSTGTPSDIECQWVSNDPEEAYTTHLNVMTSPGSLGTQTVNLSLSLYNPGSSYLYCGLKSGARLNTVVYTM